MSTIILLICYSYAALLPFIDLFLHNASWDVISGTIALLVVNQLAYFLVQSLAVLSYLSLSVLKRCATSGTNGSSGFGSVNNAQMDRRTV